MTAKIIPMNPQPVKCSFCGQKLPVGIRHFEGGNGSRICFPCITQAKQRLKDTE